VPVSFANLFRLMVLLVLAVHVFYMYCTARGMGEHFGFDLSTTIISALFALAMLVPLVWAVFLPDLPEFITQHVRPRRRWRKGLCPVCGYDRIGLPRGSSLCPECGGDLREPQPWAMTAGTVRRYIALNAVAWLLGCVVGEIWMQLDEREFRREVQQRLASRDTSMYVRARHWPNHTRTMSHSPSGYFGDDNPPTPGGMISKP